MPARPGRLRLLSTLMACLLSGACRPEGGSDPAARAPGTAEGPWFRDVAAQVGLDVVFDSGARGKWYFPEIMSGGVAWIDFDNDGFLDLYLVQSGPRWTEDPNPVGNRLFRNIGGRRFEDVTAGSGADDRGYGTGVACGDVNNDGWTDIYVTNVGPNVLLLNNGDGTFRDVTAEAGVAGGDVWSASAVFCDIDRDGDLDLYVTNYVVWSPQTDTPCFNVGGGRDYCGPRSYQPARDVLFRNDGEGRFTDITTQAGVNVAFGSGLGVIADDFNLDGWPDIYVANDQTENLLWINSGDGAHFVNEALLAGCALNALGDAEASMGVASEDLDGNGAPDLFLTHLVDETNTVYLSDGSTFVDATARTGLGPPSLPYTGFGTGFFDFDLDGHLDVFVANGRVAYQPPLPGGQDEFAEPNQLFRGLGGVRWEEVSAAAGPDVTRVETSRAAAFGDFDNDGLVDIAVVTRDGPLRLLHNRYPAPGHWVGFRVVTRSGRDAEGAHVEIALPGGRRWRCARAGYSYLASNDPRVVFGLGSRTRIGPVSVTWPDGTREQFGIDGVDRYHTLRQGAGQAVGR